MVTGSTFSSDFPIYNGPYGDQPGADAFLIGYATDLTTMRFSTYLGGSANDYGYDLVYTPWDFYVVVGTTNSTDFPVDLPLQPYNAGLSDAFVTSFAYQVGMPVSLDQSTYLGGSNYDFGIDISEYSLDLGGFGQTAIYVTGETHSSDFPTVNPIMTDQPGVDVFITDLRYSLNDLHFSTYLGGSGDDYAGGISLVRNKACAVGLTYSNDFPTQCAYQGTYGGSGDGFVTELTIFECGDANGDDAVNVSDAVHLINYVFAGGDPPYPERAGNVNCDWSVNVSDAVMIINYVFAGGNPPCDPDGDGVNDC